MSKENKDLVLNNDGNDSVVKTDDVKNELGYVKVTDLTIEEINKLPKFPVEVKKVERTYNGEVSRYYSLTLNLAPGLNLTLPSKLFKESDFYYVVMNVFVGKYKMNPNLTTFKKDFPVRFFKGTQTDSEGNSYDYHLLQIILSKGVVYSTYLNRANKQLALFETYVDGGVIVKPEWIVKNTEAVKDDDGNDLFIYE